MSQPASGQPAPIPVASAPPGVLARPDTFGRDTLRRQLVVRVTALVALAALLITTATALAARQLLMSQLDRQLDTVTARLRDPANAWPLGSPDPGLLRPGQPIGTLAVLYDTNGTPQVSGRLIERGASGQRDAAVTELPETALTQLADVPIDGTKSSIVLSGLGHYRVVGYRIIPGGTDLGSWVVGVPLHEVDETIFQLVGVAALLSLLAIVGTIFASRSLVIRSLRPLNRVAATAQQVSQ
jgi:two-component system, OmpR family, sensor kinase